MESLFPGKEKLYEGKAKMIFPGDNPGEVYMVFKDSATAFNGVKKGTIEDKGRLNAEISAILFNLLEERGIKTHYIEKVDEVTLKVRKLRILPVEVVVRNIVAGSLSKRSGREEGTPLPRPVLEIYYKSDELGDPLWNDEHVLVFGVLTEDELSEVKEMARKVSGILREFFAGRGLELVDMKLEFGRIVTSGPAGEEVLGPIVLGDEISPDTCRFWDKSTGEKLDKDRFRRDLGGVREAYVEVLRRISN
ncbi:MAG TPA: phosphoribosylaminoimidazolesuccinocarboxamide synthase [Firmicutes bacterium]|nr:phosphoribosylaminoimidazolesuccinocarboxamide synthase [Candidatus Fermentithermobacillaceae bacterium]